MAVQATIKRSLKPIFFVILFVNIAEAWDSEQLEVFDVVDEVKENFYTLLNISQDASSSEIRSSFRSLSLKLHPDKNLETDTSEQFRNLVSAYEVLRSSTKRKIYNEVLVNGLPNWRSAVYYYRFVRKMGVTEVIIILFVIVTFGQYLVQWGIYFEKKLDFSMMKKTKKTEKLQFDVPTPSMWDTLPIQLPKFFWFLVTSLVSGVKYQLQEASKPKPKPPPPEPEEIIPKVKPIRKRNKGFVVPEGPNFEVPSYSNLNSNETTNPTAPILSGGGLWTDDDLTELIRLVKKYPQGASKRWENIAEALGRPVSAVTYMANKMKENGYRLPSDQDEEPVPVKVKQKTKKEVDLTSNESRNWSQVQQKALEEALFKFPKGHAERWDRVASLVPYKTKEECILRFRFLAESLKKQRETTEEPTNKDEVKSAE